MTRINAGIPPVKLSNKHLLAEHREIKRIPNVIKSGRFHMHGQPAEFTLGTGHVKFFYDKQKYLFVRYKAIHKECLRRKFNVTDYSECWDGFFGEDKRLDLIMFCKDWTASEEDTMLIRNRINCRLGIHNLAFDDWHNLELGLVTVSPVCTP